MTTVALPTKQVDRWTQEEAAVVAYVLREVRSSTGGRIVLHLRRGPGAEGCKIERQTFAPSIDLTISATGTTGAHRLPGADRSSTRTVSARDFCVLPPSRTEGDGWKTNCPWQ